LILAIRTKYLDKESVRSWFDLEHLPYFVKKYGYDRVALRSAWNEHIDALIKEGIISEGMASRWTNPYDKPASTLKRAIPARLRSLRKKAF
jgi:hypothetical protein